VARPTRWTGGLSTSSTTVAAVQEKSVILLSSELAIKETIIRLRGTVYTMRHVAASTLSSVAFGIALLDENLTTFPSPFDDPQYPWLWWHGGGYVSHESSTSFGGHRIAVDNKAMRIVRAERLQLAMIIESQAIARYAYNIRVLLKVA